MPRIPSTYPAIMDALTPGGRPYDYTIEDREYDVDYDDPPGHYSGREVSADVAVRWDKGLKACRDAGVDARSREGLAIRHEIMHGTRELPKQLLTWIDAREAKEKADAQATAAQEAALAAYLAHFAGYEDVGADSYASTYSDAKLRAELPVIACHEHQQVENRALRLPNGDILEIQGGKTWTRWTKDPALIEERAYRRSITHHEYEPKLCARLVALEEIGALNLHFGGGSHYSWFGGTLPIDCRAGAYSGPQNRTGPEAVARLRRHLEKCITENPTHADALREALALVTDSSITAIHE